MKRRLLGAVLAGGEGRRMGSRKEQVRFMGRPLLSYARNALAPVSGGRLLLQGADGAPDGMEASPDGRRGEGPLAGIETVLRRAREAGRPAAVVAAVDLPRLPASLVAGLVRRWRDSGDAPDRAVVVWDGDRVQPLVGVYGVELGGLLTSWMDGGLDRAVHAWIESLGDRVERVDPTTLPGAVGHVEPLINVNRPEDLRSAARLPATAPPLVSVVGWKDSGKTGAAAALVGALRGRGWRVMAMKHGHHFRLDTPGTDSARLRESGAERVLLAGPDGLGLLGGWEEGAEEPEAVELAARYLAEAHVVVAEGWKDAALPAIEITSVSGNERPLWQPEAPDRDRFLARVGPGPAADREEEYELPFLHRGAPDLGERLADLVESRVIPGWER